ncbi:hypothetical protein, partial [Pseudomonas viridiflava]
MRGLINDKNDAMTYRFSAGEVLENTRRDLYRQFAAPLALERTRLLYQGSLLPTLFMFLNGLVCAWLLWGAERYLL